MAIRTDLNVPRSPTTLTGLQAFMPRAGEVSVEVTLTDDAQGELVRKLLRGARTQGVLVWGFASAAALKSLEEQGLVVSRDTVLFDNKQSAPQSYPAHAVLGLAGPLYDDWRGFVEGTGVTIDGHMSDTLGAAPRYGDHSYAITVPNRDAWKKLAQANITAGLRSWDASVDRI